MCKTMHAKPCQAHHIPCRVLAPRFVGIVTQPHQRTDVHLRGSNFLKAWMGFLEEHADLRYPNLSDVYVDEANG